MLISESASFFSGSSRDSMSKRTSSAFETVNPIGSLRNGLLDDGLLVGADFLLHDSIVAMTRLIKEWVDGGPNTASSRRMASFDTGSFSLGASLLLLLRVLSGDHGLTDSVASEVCPTSESPVVPVRGLSDETK